MAAANTFAATWLPTAYQHRRELLFDPEAGAVRDLPARQPEAHGPLPRRIRFPLQPADRTRGQRRTARRQGATGHLRQAPDLCDASQQEGDRNPAVLERRTVSGDTGYLRLPILGSLRCPSSTGTSH